MNENIMLCTVIILLENIFARFPCAIFLSNRLTGKENTNKNVFALKFAQSKYYYNLCKERRYLFNLSPIYFLRNILENIIMKNTVNGKKEKMRAPTFFRPHNRN